MTYVISTKNINQLSLNKRDVNYYIVGAFGDPFLGRITGKGTLLFFLTAFPFLFSLGTIPVVSQDIIDIHIYIYDNNLNILKEFRFEEKRIMTLSWWNKSNASKHDSKGVDDKQSRRDLFTNLMKKTEFELFNYLTRQKQGMSIPAPATVSSENNL